MKDPTSLDHLHDLVLPSEVPWWPLAPAWYAIIAIALIAAAWLAFRAWKHWQSNAYRRAALRELKSLETSAAIAELLRRTALVSAPRSVIAEKTGSAWTDWLAEQCPEPMTEMIQIQLSQAIYQPQSKTHDLSLLKNYATLWITRHSPTC